MILKYYVICNVIVWIVDCACFSSTLKLTCMVLLQTIHTIFQEDTHVNISSWEGLCPSNNTEVCLNHSGPPEECFWNQQSRISGIFCEKCEKLCRSWRTSLNFVQLIFGLLLFTLAFPIARISMTVLASDGMGSEGQVSTLHVILCICDGECILVGFQCSVMGGGGG